MTETIYNLGNQCSFAFPDVCSSSATGCCSKLFAPSEFLKQVSEGLLGKKRFLSPLIKNWPFLPPTFSALITEPSNNDYYHIGSDNGDYNFGTFNDFGIKNVKLTHKSTPV